MGRLLVDPFGGPGAPLPHCLAEAESLGGLTEDVPVRQANEVSLDGGPCGTSFSTGW